MIVFFIYKGERQIYVNLLECYRLMKSVEVNNLYVLNFLRIDVRQDRNWKLLCDYIFIFEGTTEKFLRFYCIFIERIL